MSMLAVVLIALGIYLFLGKIFIPFLKKRTFKGRFPEAVKVGWIAAGDFTRRLAITVVFTYAGFWLILKFLSFTSWVFSGSASVPTGIFNLLVSLNAWFEGVNAGRMLWVLAILAAIFFVLIIRNGRRQAQKVFEDLIQQSKEGKLSQLEPNSEMKQVEQHFGKIQQEYQRIAAIPEESLSAQEKNQKQQSLSALRKLLERTQVQYFQSDIRRRILPELETRAEAEEEKQASGGPGWWTAFLNFFTSKGMVLTVRKTSKGITTIGLVLLLLSFLVANTAPLSETVSSETRRLAQLQVVREQQKMDERWRETLTKASASSSEAENEASEEWSEEDEQTLNGIARHFELSMASRMTRPVAASVRPGAAAFRLRAEAVKGRILEVYRSGASAGDAARFRVASSGERMAVADYNDLFSQKYAETYHRNVLGDAPTTNYGKTYKQYLRQQVEGMPRSVWQDVKVKYRAAAQSFTTSATPKEVFQMMVNETVSGLSNELLDNLTPNSLEGNLSQRMGKRVSTETFKKWMDAKMTEFTDDLVRKPSYEAVVGEFRSASSVPDEFVRYAVDDMKFPTVDEVAGRLADYPSAIEHNPLKPAQMEKSERALRQLARSTDRAVGEVAEASMSYKYLFPGQPGMELETPAAKLMGEAVGADDLFSAVDAAGNLADAANGPDRTRRTTRPSSKSMRAASRARSYVSLRGFRRIGGVLIGRDPENKGETGVDFRDISWEERGAQLELFLQDAAGNRRSAGIYDRDILHQALAYAADGRPVTVTMISASPVPFLKILVHPSLVDTRLGCEAIGLDRLVDTYAARNPVVQEELLRYQYQDQLYDYTVFKLLQRQSNDPSLSSYVMQSEFRILNAWSEIYRSLERGAVLDDPERSHIAARAELYDPDVVAILKYSLSQCGGSFTEYKKLLEAESVYASDITDLIKVSTDLWSGVREMDYVIDSGLSFLDNTDPETRNVFPLRFTEQVAYVPTNETANLPSAETPWEFPQLTGNNVLNRLVYQGVQTKSKDRILFARMRSFTLAQRIFRAAVNGDLGYEFPLEKLHDLARDTQAGVTPVETPTWNGYLTVEEVQNSEMDESAKEAFMELIEAEGISATRNKYPCN